MTDISTTDQIIIYAVMALITTIAVRLAIFKEDYPADMIGAGFFGVIWPVTVFVAVVAGLLVILTIVAEVIIGLGRWIVGR